jgi:hypothetical protein
MLELLSKLESDELIGLVAILCTAVCGIVAIIGAFWYHIRKIETLTVLKKDMLERGMSPEQIRVVIEAGTTTTCGKEQNAERLRHA